MIAHQRTSKFQQPAADETIKPPGKNRAQSFLKRRTKHLSRRTKAIDDKRHDHNIYEKVVSWFTLSGLQLQNPAAVADNVYNKDETAVQSYKPCSMKVLVNRAHFRHARRAGRTQITAVESISASGRSLPPLVVWPASTHRDNCTTFPPSGWHFAVSPSGYVDTEISLHWIRRVFDPLINARSRGRPRLLITDGFATHESRNR